VRVTHGHTVYFSPGKNKETMPYIPQLDDLTSTLRRTRARLLAPIDFRQHQLPTDPEVFVEDVLNYMLDEWSSDLRTEGHVLEEDTAWKNSLNHYPRYVLRMAGGTTYQLHFTGHYPETLFLNLSKGFRNANQFSDAKHAQLQLPMSPDPQVLLNGLFDGLKRYNAS
jgi:hypothetical protein